MDDWERVVLRAACQTLADAKACGRRVENLQDAVTRLMLAGYTAGEIALFLTWADRVRSEPLNPTGLSLARQPLEQDHRMTPPGADQAEALAIPDAPAEAEPLPVAAPRRVGLKPGIYFGLSNDAYHADPALGSTNLRKLANNPADYWYESPYNPHREPDRETPARVRGSAMHTLVLEGLPAFDAIYTCGPHNDGDMTASEKGAATKAAKAKAAALGKVLLPADDYDRVMIAGAMISKNPKLTGIFQGGAPEVSVFWEQDGLMFKIRIDYLKPRGIGDLKSITNIHSKAFADACHDSIANYRYDVQGKHYLNGRGKMPGLIDAGLVFGLDIKGGMGNQYRDLLVKVRDAKAYAFQWVFFAADKAPLTYSAILSPRNPLCEIGQQEIDVGIRNYRRFMETFGPDSMWLELEEPAELELESMPGWFARTRRKS